MFEARHCFDVLLVVTRCTSCSAKKKRVYYNNLGFTLIVVVTYEGILLYLVTNLVLCWDLFTIYLCVCLIYSDLIVIYKYVLLFRDQLLSLSHSNLLVKLQVNTSRTGASATLFCVKMARSWGSDLSQKGETLRTLSTTSQSRVGTVAVSVGMGKCHFWVSH